MPLRRFWRSGPMSDPYSESVAQFLIVLLVTYFSLVLGELVPKRLALQSAELIARIMARPMTMVAVLSTPVIWVLTLSTNSAAAVARSG
jgi:putative hemolysin